MNKLLLVLATLIVTLLSVIMLSSWPSALGGLAAWVTTVSFLIQVIHIIKNKDTSGLSLGMWSSLFFGVACWSSYGYKIGDFPVMFANGITVVLAGTVIFLKLWHEKPWRRIAER
ncbi:SemiSWEET family sugar transporter [Pseudomonas sp. Larv2_ips]|uniref:SemiSWEET family sugar transporter n=1 Tax=Pseudomonas sp. Larv2_ips TaxID=1896942 RepID=UPI000E6D2B45|nr:SemiSWEET family transporter [Pseudomonas sp. Larv2_ips]